MHVDSAGAAHRCCGLRDPPTTLAEAPLDPATALAPLSASKGSTLTAKFTSSANASPCAPPDISTSACTVCEKAQGSAFMLVFHERRLCLPNCSVRTAPRLTRSWDDADGLTAWWARLCCQMALMGSLLLVEVEQWCDDARRVHIMLEASMLGITLKLSTKEPMAHLAAMLEQMDLHSDALHASLEPSFGVDGQN